MINRERRREENGRGGGICISEGSFVRQFGVEFLSKKLPYPAALLRTAEDKGSLSLANHAARKGK